MENHYIYDVAISLCKQDIEFARALVNALNPKLNVFFYETRQEELISKSGPEAFGKIFRDQARVVVILSRKEWGESYYTEIERNAIIDRTSLQNQGYDFLMVIPMLPDEVPPWYPRTRIYVNPRSFGLEDIARFVEFKITDQGGIVTPLTFREYIDHYTIKKEAKISLIRLQGTPEAANEALIQQKRVLELFSEKMGLLQTRLDWAKLYPPTEFATNGYILSHNTGLVINYDPINSNDFHCQDATIVFTLLDVREGQDSKIIEQQEYKYLYHPTRSGWCIPEYISTSDHHTQKLLFGGRTGRHFNLQFPIVTDELIENWFIKFIKTIESGNSKLLSI